MIGRAGFSSKCWRVLRWAGLAAAAPALWACTSRTLEAPDITPTATLTTNFTQKINNEIDILFMIDNSSSMTEMQQKLYVSCRLFMNVLAEPADAAQPAHRRRLVGHGRAGRLDHLDHVHARPGTSGQFQSMPRGTCTATTITAGGDDLHLRRRRDAELHRPDRDGVPVHRAPRRQGLRLREPAGVDRSRARRRRTGPAARSTNAGFLRPEAYLGIVILTNEDDCSAPATRQLYSLNGGQQNIANPLGPIANYRCNQFGHTLHQTRQRQRPDDAAAAAPGATP